MLMCEGDSIQQIEYEINYSTVLKSEEKDMGNANGRASERAHTRSKDNKSKIGIAVIGNE